MKTRAHILVSGMFAAALMAVAPSAKAQVQTTGTVGSPGAATTIDGKQLPAPDPKFGGAIKENAMQSKTWRAPRIVPPKGAPNVLLIITDDSGFGVPSTFGGLIPTPTLDRVVPKFLARASPWDVSPERRCLRSALPAGSRNPTRRVAPREGWSAR